MACGAGLTKWLVPNPCDEKGQPRTLEQLGQLRNNPPEPSAAAPQNTELQIPFSAGGGSSMDSTSTAVRPGEETTVVHVGAAGRKDEIPDY